MVSVLAAALIVGMLAAVNANAETASLRPASIGSQDRPAGPPTTMPPVNETGTQFYSRYLEVVRNATTVHEIVALWNAEMTKQFNAAPTAERMNLNEIKRVYSGLANVKVVKETTTAAGATLTLEGVSADKSKLAGTVDLIKENSAWKITGLGNWKQ